MTTATWPGTLPQAFLVGTMQRKGGDGRLRSSPDIGPALVRRRTSSVVDQLSGQMMMSDAQIAVLVSFGHTTLDGWALPFTFPDPAGGSDLLVRFADGVPERSDVVPGYYRVGLSLEVLP